MRQFGLIGSSIWRSRRFRSLSTDTARLTYFYLHTSTHGNSAGCFVLPPELAALELRRDAADIREAIEELRDVELIRYDPDEELVQIIGFFRFNSPSSRKQLAGPLRVIREALPRSPVRDAAACDLIVAMYQRAMGWDPKIEARGAFLHDAASLVQELHLNDTLTSPEIGLPNDLLIGLSEALLIDLAIQGHYQDHRHNTITDTITDTTTITTTERGVRGERPAQVRPSPPADGGRAARQTPEDIQRTIQKLGESRRVK